MNVLNLVTDERPFYTEQIRALEAKGISQTTLEVPGRNNQFDSRSVADYLRFYPTVLKESVRGYDLVHANFGLTAPFALAQIKRPVVLSLWGSDVHDTYGIIGKKSAPYFQEVITMNEQMSREVPAECTVIPHGINLKKFHQASKKECREELGWGDACYVLFPYAPNRTNKRHSLAKDVVEEANSLTNREIILKTVYNIEHDDIPTYMNASDVLLITSDKEGTPNSVKEAMACNLPVVSRDVGNISEMLSGVSPSSVVSDVDNLPETLVEVLRKESASNGRKKAERYSLERMADDIIDVYESALE